MTMLSGNVSAACSKLLEVLCRWGNIDSIMASGSDVVRDCSGMLIHAESDVEKISALLFAAQHIRSDECDSRSKAVLFKSVGVDFLSRMLLGRLRIPESEDCPRETYVSTAFAIITGFCLDPDLAKDKEMLELVPTILRILEESDEYPSEEALQYLRCIIQHPEGRRALLSHGALKTFAHLFTKFKSDEIVDMTLILTQTPGIDNVWGNDKESFHLLISSVATEFEKNNSKAKFKLCLALRCLMYSYNNDIISFGATRVIDWHTRVLHGLQDILTSRIDDEQRDPALKLAAMMLDHFGIDWIERSGLAGSRKFLLLLVHLCSIEIRMQLEDQTLDRILKKADLVTSCFSILEVVVTQFLHNNADSRTKNQIVELFTEASTAVLATIKTIKDSPDTPRQTTEEKFFIYAMIRFLSLGFAHEVLTLNSSVYEIMPFIVGVATDSFYSYKNWFEENAKTGATGHAPAVGEQPADFLPVLLPALRQFTTEKGGREIILGLIDAFLDCLAFHWSTVESQLALLQVGDQDAEALFDEKNCAWQDAKNTIVGLFELLTEVILIEPEVMGNSKFASLFFFITEMLRDLDPDINAVRPIHATASILGLLLVKYRAELHSENDPNVALVVRSALKFLKSYSKKYDDSVFALNRHRKFWVNIEELRLLGIHTIRKLLVLMPWIKPEIESVMGSASMFTDESWNDHE